ncbi:hypothetical protein LSTR_LSTR005819 [Laodelphax striatellus]|uniref:O-acyltransferase WSD1 C-terminal domain-containing protein n=1 Tax=Laodelphax striatellus TaxID=195883 RepID=A0A482WR63_LAOST|nr:hypothetical protein LSTR_LSTR005819 [Laodelphax striatellus]
MKQSAVSGWLRLGDALFQNLTNSSSQTQKEPILLQSNETEEYVETNSAIAIGAAVALLLHAYISHSRKAGVSVSFALAALVMTAVIAPIIGSIFLLLACYRQCVITLLKVKCKKGTFAGLMQGNDAFWAVEEDASRSVINILALADFSFIVEASRKGEEPLNTVQELIEERLLSSPCRFPKLLCYRRQAMGYFFWERQPSIDVQDHVRWMDYPRDQPDQMVSEKVLKSYVSSQVNSPLPAYHASGWEILISRYPLKVDNKSDPLDAMETGNRVDNKYPVLFRVHHSLGDGVALIRLLLDALADPCSRTPSRTPSPMFDTAPMSDDRLRSSTPQTDYYKSNILNIPEQDFRMKKSASLNFDDRPTYDVMKSITPSTSLKDCVRFACRKFISFLDEANEINRLQYQTQSLQNINILINDQPADEYLCSVSETNEKQKSFAIRPSNLLVSRKDRRKFESFFVERDEEVQSGIKQYFWEKLKSFKGIIYHLGVLALLPATVMNQSVARINDENALHGPQLSGYKVVGWYFEDENCEDDTLMSKIKRIRMRTGTHFSDVLLTALSTSMEDFFRRFNEVPHDITVVIPARLGRPDEGESSAKVASAVFSTKDLKATVTKLYMDRNAKRNHSVIYEDAKTKLDNKFSVALLSLPIASETPTREELFGKLRRVQKRTGVLRKSADYIVNYWILKVIATLFPVPILREVTKSTQSSMVVSNMPGPQKQAKLAGQTLHNIVFWVPNRDSTGLGISILSYGGRLQLGIIADRALIPCSEDAQLVVDGVVEAINKMDKISSPQSST